MRGKKKIAIFVAAGAIALAVAIWSRSSSSEREVSYLAEENVLGVSQGEGGYPQPPSEARTPAIKKQSLRLGGSAREKRPEDNVAQGTGDGEVLRGRVKKFDVDEVIARKRAQSVQPAAPSITYEDLSPEEQALFDKIEAAFDTDNLEDAIKTSALVLESGSKTVKEQMIFTLGWFGEKAIEELLPYLADPDEEVADWALSNWNSALAEVESEKDKIRIVETVMKSLTGKEYLEDVAMEYLDVDDRLAIESLIRVIDTAKEEGAAQARETYSAITGEDYTTPEAARQWMQDFAPDTANE